MVLSVINPKIKNEFYAGVAFTGGAVLTQFASRKWESVRIIGATVIIATIFSAVLKTVQYWQCIEFREDKQYVPKADLENRIFTSLNPFVNGIFYAIKDSPYEILDGIIFAALARCPVAKFPLKITKGQISPSLISGHMLALGFALFLVEFKYNLQLKVLESNGVPIHIRSDYALALQIQKEYEKLNKRFLMVSVLAIIIARRGLIHLRTIYSVLR